MGIGVINFAAPSTGDWLVNIIKWLIGISSSIGVGVILFTILLKLITTPFDVVSRISMRKNSLKMEEMRPELEKLQKQYAHDKNLYSQKMMALYKREGYSMWGSCLPTIITLVIFIVAINAFTSYSNFQNRQYFYDMSVSYNQVIYDGFEQNDYIYYDEENKTFVVEDNATTADLSGTNLVREPDGGAFIFYTTNGYMKLRLDTNGARQYLVYEDNIKSNSNCALYNGYQEAKKVNAELTATSFVSDLCSQASADTFRDENASFLWVKNIFMQDSAASHPIYKDWNSFKKNFKYKNEVNGVTIGSMDEDGNDYLKLISKLENETKQANGYYILVALTALSSLITQLIMTKSQKAQMELQTVDGQGAQTQKTMMIIMPIMMAVFSFMYTAAFSIYIVLSNIISCVFTLLINYFTDKAYKNKQSKKVPEKIRGRVHDVKQEEPKATPKKKEKNAIPVNDFLSGKADKKRK